MTADSAPPQKFRASIPMPDDWLGRIEDIERPEGLTVEVIEECAGLVHEWERSKDYQAAPLIILIAEIVLGRDGGR